MGLGGWRVEIEFKVSYDLIKRKLHFSLQYNCKREYIVKVASGQRLVQRVSKSGPK